MLLQRKNPYHVWESLNGLLCLYKPVQKSPKCLVRDVQSITSQGMRRMGEEPPRQIVRLESSALGELVHITETDYSDHSLVIGPQYLREDVQVQYANFLCYLASGVCVLGINKGIHAAKELAKSKPLKVYHVSGKFGISTANYFSGGRIVEKATTSHICRSFVDKIAANMQANYQRAMFIQTGVPLQSQAAYDMAVGGLIRPDNDRIPTVYGLKCIHFERPFFTLEVNCINETEEFLLKLIYNIGLRCRSVATCTKIQCIRFGPFTVKNALLRHSWNAESFAKNILENNDVYNLNQETSIPNDHFEAATNHDDVL